jgi:CHAT domain-containing protein
MGDVNYTAAPEKIEDRPAWINDKPTNLGSMVFPRGALARVAAAVPQVNAVAKAFATAAPEAPVHKLLDRKATENAFRSLAPESRWIYLATHGFFDKEVIPQAVARVRSMPGVTLGAGGGRPPTSAVLNDPGLWSGLTFAGANEANDPDQDDGVLWALELAAMNLTGVDLAVLSACQTAEGEVSAGEGVLSVQRAFHTAGTRTVVSTTWSVHVQASLLLVERLMNNLIKKKMPKGEALREAQAWMLAAARATKPGDRLEEPNYESAKLPPLYMLPYFWSGFVMSGDWR